MDKNKSAHSSTSDGGSVPLHSVCNIVRKAIIELKCMNSLNTGKRVSTLSPQLQLALRQRNQLSGSQDYKAVQQVLYNLSKGYLVKKHSINTNGPHLKYVYISNNKRELCWKSLDKNDEKKIELKKIKKIVNENVESYIRSKTITKLQNIIAIIGQSRTLELQINNEFQFVQFYQELLIAISNSKGIHLNYKI